MARLDEAFAAILTAGVEAARKEIAALSSSLESEDIDIGGLKEEIAITIKAGVATANKELTIWRKSSTSSASAQRMSFQR